MFITGRTRMSSRGQLVIPQALRHAAGIQEGDEIEVLYDGQRLILGRAGGAGDPSSAEQADAISLVVREGEPAYPAAGAVAGAHPPALARRQSVVWADRVQALAAIKRLGVEFAGVSLSDLLAQARRELEDRLPPC